ncbi:zf-HC2 domain-containing protein [Leeia sp. TBRC 13508]|uniref:Zf-HC2 domain-containing protein n=1 Tax=Leeia speluncae TaxID=2884804 RepID=A0ABS8D6X8_9NEIS|nr:zf-HC2 domain-containing protein [Leeia speluncae]MCB6183949.1 zf-HC2 domain-containing protein [Leeia speluncae]
MRPLKSCRKATFLLSCKRDRPLTTTETVWLKIHLAMCIHCRRFGKQIDHLGSIANLFPESSEKSR